MKLREDIQAIKELIQICKENNVSKFEVFDADSDDEDKRIGDGYTIEFFHPQKQIDYDYSMKAFLPGQIVRRTEAQQEMPRSKGLRIVDAGTEEPVTLEGGPSRDPLLDYALHPDKELLFPSDAPEVEKKP